MALTDLTGTTWTLNDSLTSYAGGSYSTKTYSVNITTAEQLPDVLGDYSDSFVHLETGYDGGGEYNRVCFSTSSSGYPPTVVAYGNDTKTLPDTWNSRYEGTFTITGGTDATNSVLIAWLEENCTDSTPATPDVVVTYEGANIVELSEAGTKPSRRRASTSQMTWCWPTLVALAAAAAWRRHPSRLLLLME